jgi:hypothetical protein
VRQHNNMTSISNTFNCTVCSESRYVLGLRYVDLVVGIEFAFEVCCCFTVSVVKQRLKCNTGKVLNCLIQF